MTPAVVLLALRLLLAIALYAFLAAVLFLVWRDVGAASRARNLCPPAHLVVVEGAEAGRMFPLGEASSLGRAADNTVCLGDDMVSAYHARVSHQGGQWWLEDLGSRNGTRLNEILVEQPLVLTYGDRVRVGRVVLRLEPSVGSGIEPRATGDETAPVGED
jgi:hypothetical protein